MNIIVSGLLKKRTELASKLAEQDKALQQTKADMLAIDATIRLYQPDHELPVLGPVRRQGKRKRFFEAGEITPLIRDFMREWSEDRSPSSNDVIYALAKIKAIHYDELTDKHRQAFYKSIQQALKRGVKNGWLLEDYREQGLIHWKLVALSG